MPYTTFDHSSSLPADKLVRIYLNNNICIQSEPKHLEFFDDYFIYDGKSASGTIYYPDQDKIYPSWAEKMNQGIGNNTAVPYSAICVVTDVV